jgi:Domain of unknown function (DUF1707)
MSQMTTDTPRVRTSDAERERIAQTLRAAVGEGRLTLEEGDERLATLYTTKYRDELAPLIADLPASASADDTNRRGPGWGRGRNPQDEVWSPETDSDARDRPQGYGPPWAGPGWGGHPNGPGTPGWGGPGWGGPGWTRRPGPPWFLLPLLPILFLFVIFGAIGGIVHGHFFAIIPLALLTFAILRIARFRHRWGGWRR